MTSCSRAYPIAAPNRWRQGFPSFSPFHNLVKVALFRIGPASCHWEYRGSNTRHALCMAHMNILNLTITLVYPGYWLAWLINQFQGVQQVLKRRRLLIARYDVRSPRHEHHSHIYPSTSPTASLLFFRHTPARPCSIATDDSALVSPLQ